MKVCLSYALSANDSYLTIVSFCTGFSTKVLKESGLLDSGLGGSEGDVTPGSDGEDKAEEAEQAPADNASVSSEEHIADKKTPSKGASTKTPSKKTPSKKTPAKSPYKCPDGEFCGEFGQLNLFDLDKEDEMQILTIYKPEVRL